MAIKYRIDFVNRNDENFKIEIDVPAYVGQPILFDGSGGSALEITTQGGSDNPFDEHVQSSQASVTFILPPDQTIEDLQLCNDLEVKLKVYKNNALFWSGFVISDGLQELYKGYNERVTITASDGLKQLDGLVFETENISATIQMPTYSANFRCPLAYIRGILQNIDNLLTIVWNCDIKNLKDTTKDFLAGVTELDPTGGLVRYNYMDCEQLLFGILKSANLHISQADGKWYIKDNFKTYRDNGIINGFELNYYTATNYTENVNRSFTEIEDDTVIMSKKPISKVEVTYKNTRNENVLPNGDMNLSTNEKPTFWVSNTDSYLIWESITERTKDQYGNPTHSTKIFSGGNSYFALNNFLNFDAHTLFPRFSLGFKFMCENFPTRVVDGQTNIDWTGDPLRLEVSYTAMRDGVTYQMFLNENGFWNLRGIGGSLVIVSQSWNNINKRLNITLSGGSSMGDVLSVIEYMQPNPDDPRQDYEFLNEYQINANLSTVEDVVNYLVANYGFTKTSYNTVYKSYNDRYYRDPYASVRQENVNPNGTTNYIPIMVNQLKNGDVADLQFTSKGNQGRITIPDPGELVGVNSLGRGNLRVKFILPLRGTNVNLQDVYINIDENNDKYILTLPAKKDSLETHELTISSSFSGFMLSSYMNSYSDSDANMLFYKNGVTATLTEHYGRDVLLLRSTPNKIVETSLNGYVRPIDEITFYGKKFVPLSVVYNAETNISKVTLFEMKINTLSGLIVKHEASNLDNIR